MALKKMCYLQRFKLNLAIWRVTLQMCYFVGYFILIYYCSDHFDFWLETSRTFIEQNIHIKIALACCTVYQTIINKIFKFVISIQKYYVDCWWQIDCKHINYFQNQEANLSSGKCLWQSPECLENTFYRTTYVLFDFLFC